MGSIKTNKQNKPISTLFLDFFVNRSSHGRPPPHVWVLPRILYSFRFSRLVSIQVDFRDLAASCVEVVRTFRLYCDRYLQGKYEAEGGSRPMCLSVVFDYTSIIL